MDSLIIQGFRCFGHRVEVPLRPLTLLVGENSTGKSTFLGAVRLAWDLADGTRLNFREAPFDFGHLSDFCHEDAKGNRSEMHLGFSETGSDKRGHQDDIAFEFVLADVDGEVVPKSVEVRRKNFALRGQIREDGKVEVITKHDGGASKSIAPEVPPWFLQRGLGALRYLALDSFEGKTKGRKNKDVLGLLEAIEVMRSRRHLDRPYANAPVRARPERVYTPGQLTAEPEGSHAPAVLAKLLSRGNRDAQRARDLILGYGKASGLFSSFDVKQFGDGKQGDPFQVLFGIDGQGRARNAIDVGYGISQILPLLVDLVSLKTSTFLLQQPEVHLHPVAQAAIGSLLLQEAKKGRQFLVETHSDFILDRVCIDVHDGKATPEDVQILYFERRDDGAQVKIHPISLDQEGNLCGAPPSYRAFFERETRRFLGL